MEVTQQADLIDDRKSDWDPALERALFGTSVGREIAATLVIPWPVPIEVGSRSQMSEKASDTIAFRPVNRGSGVSVNR